MIVLRLKYKHSSIWRWRYLSDPHEDTYPLITYIIRIRSKAKIPTTNSILLSPTSILSIQSPFHLKKTPVNITPYHTIQHHPFSFLLPLLYPISQEEIWFMIKPLSEANFLQILELELELELLGWVMVDGGGVCCILYWVRGGGCERRGVWGWKMGGGR